MRETIDQSATPGKAAAPASPTRRRGFSWRLPLLVAGDALCFVIFALAGRRSHAESQGFGAILWTAFPFALGWFVVAPLLGAYRRRATSRGPARALAAAETAWLGAYPAALLARWALAPDHRIPLSFAVIILLANAILLGGWRALFAFLRGRLTR